MLQMGPAKQASTFTSALALLSASTSCPLAVQLQHLQIANAAAILIASSKSGKPIIEQNLKLKHYLSLYMALLISSVLCNHQCVVCRL